MDNKTPDVTSPAPSFNDHFRAIMLGQIERAKWVCVALQRQTQDSPIDPDDLATTACPLCHDGVITARLNGTFLADVRCSTPGCFDSHKLGVIIPYHRYIHTQS